jgi:hypothetical protein
MTGLRNSTTVIHLIDPSGKKIFSVDQLSTLLQRDRDNAGINPAQGNFQECYQPKWFEPTLILPGRMI